MASKTALKGIWFSIHKWIGILLAILIIPIALSGSALVWHDWVDETLNPQRQVAAGAAAELPLATYLSAAGAALQPGEAIASIRYPDGEGAVLVSAVLPPAAAKGARPPRVQLWLDPADAKLLDRANSNAGFVRVMHVLHGSLMTPGIGRQIVGWVGVAMFLSCLTGLWLWLPTIGRWTRGFAWRAERTFSTNLHHQMGFWIAIPLAMLSFTGAWISFPQFFNQFSAQPVAKGPAGPDRAARARARPLGQTALTPEAAVTAAQALAPGALKGVTWPTDLEPKWRVALAGTKGDIEVTDAGAVATKAKAPPAGNTLARTMRRWHDGTGMGVVWQVIIFVGGIIPAALAVTGIIMWLRTRVWRGEVTARRKAAKAST